MQGKTETETESNAADSHGNSRSELSSEITT